MKSASVRVRTAGAGRVGLWSQMSTEKPKATVMSLLRCVKVLFIASVLD